MSVRNWKTRFVTSHDFTNSPFRNLRQLSWARCCPVNDEVSNYYNDFFCQTIFNHVFFFKNKTNKTDDLKKWIEIIPSRKCLSLKRQSRSHVTIEWYINCFHINFRKALKFGGLLFRRLKNVNMQSERGHLCPTPD